MHSKYKYLKVYLITLLLIGSLILGSVFIHGFDSSLLSKLSFYVDLANPNMKVVKVQEGMRKEEVAEVVGDKLNWNDNEKDFFVNLHIAFGRDNLEGMYYPKTYLIHKNEDPVGVGEQMLEELDKQMEKIEKKENNMVLNRETMLKIAIIQREAGGKNDMATISGVIWNRLWDGMKLQMDATLQYAKGSEEDGWWPRVRKDDKYIDSEYNTYLYNGLPPGPIANPGPAAIYAAYHPKKTSCYFYLHDREGRIHCSRTYKGHLENIERYY
jgi:UPF0755 protein